MGDVTENFSMREFRVSDLFPEIAERIEFNLVDRVKTYFACRMVLQPAHKYLTEMYASPGLKIGIFPTSGIRVQDLFEALRDAGYDPSSTSDHFWHLLYAHSDIPQKWATDLVVKKKIGKEKWEYSRAATESLYHFIRERMQYSYGQLIFYDKLGHVHFSLPNDKNQGEAWIQQ